MSRIKFNILLICILVSQVYPQVGLQITQNTSIANGEQSASGSTSDYKINENLFDINATYKNFYIYSQLEYSDPPVFGASKTTIEDFLNLFSIEYNGIFNLKIGDIHTVESRGLVFNSYQDQSTDFDNGVFGVKASYGKDWFDVSFIHGSDEYEFRSNPVNQLNDFSYDHTTTYLSTSIYPTDNIYLNFQFQNQSIDVSDGVIAGYYSRNFTTMLGSFLILNQQNFQNDLIDSYQINSNVLGLSLETNIYGIDIYSEYVKNKYTKLEPGVRSGQKIDGSLFYSSLYTDILGNGVTYEFKRYDTPYFIPTLSYGPIVYREATSTLQSKVVHNMNFVNELGHQLDINRMVGDNINLTLNLSTARRIHPFNGQMKVETNVFDTLIFQSDIENNGYEDAITNFNSNNWQSSTEIDTYSYQNPNIMSILFMDIDEEVLAFWPYRQLFTEISGDLFNDRLYFSIGYDLFDHIKQWGAETESGMTHNIYNFTGYDSVLSTTASNYWDLELETYQTNIDDYWTIFNYYINFMDSSTAHEQVSPQFGFDIDEYIDEYNNVENNINTLVDSTVAASSELINQYIISDHPSSNSNKWNYEIERATTLPLSFAWTFENGNSILTYIEQQWREKEFNYEERYISGHNISNGSKLEKFNEQYFSLTFKHIKFGTFTFISNHEKQTISIETGEIENSNRWDGYQWTYDFHQKSSNNMIARNILGDSRLSIFYGSQKGGLVCANGICATQPEFLNGYKLNYTRLF